MTDFGKTVTREDLEERLIHIIRETDWLMRALTAVRATSLPDGCIGAGAIRNTVWDYLLGATAPGCPDDVDVAYYCSQDPSQDADEKVQSRLALLEPDLPWEVVNQAGVHLWFPAHFGYTIAPLASIVDAISSWPETATAVAVALNSDDNFRVIAPFGLADLFEMKLRRNSKQCSVEIFRDRIASKRIMERWPNVRIIDEV